MTDSEKGIENLDLLYGTLDEPDKWSEWLSHTCDLLRAEGGNISLLPIGHDAEPRLILNCLSDAEFETYTTRYSDKDFWVEHWADMAAGDVRSTGGVSPALFRAYLDSEFFQEFATGTCCRNQMGGLFYRSDGWTGHVGIHRHDLDDPFTPIETKLVAGLLPHVRRVWEQHDYVQLLEDAVATLGRSGDGILLIDGEGKVQYANATAAQVVNDGWLHLEDGVLTANSSTDTARLRSALSDVLTQDSAARFAGCDFFVSRPDHPLPLILSVAPNQRRVPFEQTHSAIKAVVTVIDPVARKSLEQRLLASLYGLTGREIEVCELLLGGDNLRTISDRLQISYETVRRHLKTICQKVQIRSQPQLVAFLRALSR